jgi:hypothetical protein
VRSFARNPHIAHEQGIPRCARDDTPRMCPRAILSAAKDLVACPPVLFRVLSFARMEIPSKISIFNRTLEVKGKPGTLVAINDLGFYEVVLEVQQRNHTVLFPIAETVLIFNEALPQTALELEVER